MEKDSDLETVNYYDNYTFLQKYSAELGSLVSDFQVKGSCAQGGKENGSKIFTENYYFLIVRLYFLRICLYLCIS